MDPLNFENFLCQWRTKLPLLSAIGESLGRVVKPDNKSHEQIADWLLFTNQIISSGRQQQFDILRLNNYKIGLNILANKLYYLKSQINLDLLNLSLLAFKKDECAFLRKKYSFQ